jgi:hypothetical protein
MRTFRAMSEDETLVLVFSAVLSLVLWGRWYYYLTVAVGPRTSPYGRRWLAITPLLCLAAIFTVLRVAASFDVRNSPTYLLFYVVFGATWIAASMPFAGNLGVRFRDDALERRNPAAVIAIIGHMLGLSACYTGANIGDGPGWWCVLFAGLLATTAWFLLLLIFELGSKVSESITVERDVNAAMRFCGLAIATGILCGRGAAGDWTSAEQTVHEFVAAWPALLIVTGACVVERSLRENHRSERPAEWPDHVSASATLIASIYIILAILAVAMLGPVPDNPLYAQ